MKIGEVKVYDTPDGSIWSKKIGEQFHLVNGVYCAGADSLDMDDVSVLKRFLAASENVLFPYPGADAGYVISFFELMARPGNYGASNILLSYFEHISKHDCEVALREYRSWAGVSC